QADGTDHSRQPESRDGAARGGTDRRCRPAAQSARLGGRPRAYLAGLQRGGVPSASPSLPRGTDEEYCRTRRLGRGGRCIRLLSISPNATPAHRLVKNGHFELLGRVPVCLNLIRLKVFLDIGCSPVRTMPISVVESRMPSHWATSCTVPLRQRSTASKWWSRRP